MVEVSNNTFAFDRINKSTLYARNRIPEYWILNLRDRTLEVHRRPSGGTYTERDVLTSEQGLSPLISNSKCVAEIGTAGGFGRGRKRDE